MKRVQLIIMMVAVTGLAACHKTYIDDVYVEPQASFSMSVKDTVNILQAVTFTNKGKGQTYAVWTGDNKHVYGKQENTGFAVGTSGVFSYSYSEPGTYKIVWVASSMNAKGEAIHQIDSARIVVVDTHGGLDNISIYKIYRMDDYDATRNTYYTAKATRVNDSVWTCGVIYEAWRNGTINSIKSKKLFLKYQLTSTSASLLWWDVAQTKWVTVRSEIDYFCVMNGNKIAPQRVKVRTASGYEKEYVIYTIMMPKLTAFGINGVNATIEHEYTSYNVYNVSISLPAGTDLKTLKPEWTLMAGDANLLDGAITSVKVNGVEQVSGTSEVDFSQGVVEYKLTYQPYANVPYQQESIMRVKVIDD